MIVVPIVVVAQAVAQAVVRGGRHINEGIFIMNHYDVRSVLLVYCMYITYSCISFNERARKMDNTKRETIKATIAQGLASANKGSVFWTKADAMQSFAAFHKSAK